MPVRPARTVVAGVALGLAAVLAVAMPAAAQEVKKEDKKLQESQRREIAPVARALDQAMSQATTPTGSSSYVVDMSKDKGGVAPGTDTLPFTFKMDAMKSNDGKSYVPFMFMFDAGKLPATSVAFAFRVVPKGTVVPVPEKDKKSATEVTWEEYSFAEVRPATIAKMQQLSRVFMSAGGTYDLYYGMRARNPSGKDKDPVKVLVLKQEVEVPDLTNGLATSSVMILSKFDQVSTPLAADMQKERPWVMGNLELVPSLDRKFKKNEELGIYFQIYNAKLENDKPDLTVEYAFHQKQADGEKYFNKTSPQAFNAQTLPAEWSASAGHTISAGQSIPLASFPEGDYRLEIKVTDKKGATTITREALFSVVPAAPAP